MKKRTCLRSAVLSGLSSIGRFSWEGRRARIFVGRKPTSKDFYFWSRQLKRRSMLAAITFRVPNDEIVLRPALQRERRLMLRCTSLILALSGNLSVPPR